MRCLLSTIQAAGFQQGRRRQIADAISQINPDIARDMVEAGHACDWPRFSGGHYSGNGVGRPCPDGHRERRRRAR